MGIGIQGSKAGHFKLRVKLTCRMFIREYRGRIQSDNGTKRLPIGAILRWDNGVKELCD